MSEPNMAEVMQHDLDVYTQAYTRGILAERERCAAIAKKYIKELWTNIDEIEQEILQPATEKKATPTPPEGFELVVDRSLTVQDGWIHYSKESEAWMPCGLSIGCAIHAIHNNLTFARPIQPRKEVFDNPSTFVNNPPHETRTN